MAITEVLDMLWRLLALVAVVNILLLSGCAQREIMPTVGDPIRDGEIEEELPEVQQEQELAPEDEAPTEDDVGSGGMDGCYLPPFTELVEQSSLIFIGTFVENSDEFEMLNEFPIFEDLEVIKGVAPQERITIMGGGGFPYRFEAGERYMVFTHHDEEQDINVLMCTPLARDYKIRTDETGKQIMGCLREYDRCIREERECPPGSNETKEPIVRSANGMIIPQPPQPERKCYEEGYAIVSEVIEDIKNV